MVCSKTVLLAHGLHHQGNRVFRSRSGATPTEIFRLFPKKRGVHGFHCETRKRPKVSTGFTRETRGRFCVQESHFFVFLVSMKKDVNLLFASLADHLEPSFLGRYFWTNIRPFFMSIFALHVLFFKKSGHEKNNKKRWPQKFFVVNPESICGHFRQAVFVPR